MRERLAKQDARARTRSSSGAFARECAEQLIESRKLSTAARRCGCRAGTARLLFFCRRFLFQTKRKCRNAGNIKCLIMVGCEGRVRIIQFHIVPLARHRCVEVTAPYMLRVNKFVQISRADDIRSYCELFHYSLLLITLSEAKQTPQSRLTPSQLPYRGAYKKSPDSYLNSTPFVRQYDILSNKWGVLLCQKEYQTNDIRQSSREWL